jgi:hypothetical protein
MHSVVSIYCSFVKVSKQHNLILIHIYVLLDRKSIVKFLCISALKANTRQIYANNHIQTIELCYYTNGTEWNVRCPLYYTNSYCNGFA